MLSLARVLSVTENSQKVILAPVFSPACINCPSIKNCGKNNKTFTGINSTHFKLSEGTIVRIELKPPVKFLFGLCALFFPIALCALASLFSVQILTTLNFCVNEYFKFALCLLAFFAGEGIVLALSRAPFIPSKPVIKQVL